MDDPLPQLNLNEVRVLGSLIEKQISTPDYYPLTLNALTNACNQLTNRDPIVAFDETTVVRALDGLREKRLATLFHGAESRVAKYRHNFGDVVPVTPAELALICVLMLRGAQTVGELRSRTDRLFAFDGLSEVEASLANLCSRSPPLIVKLQRQPGAKESRYAHLLAGSVEPATNPRQVPMEPATVAVREEDNRFANIERQVSELRRELDELKREFAEFKKQFEG